MIETPTFTGRDRALLIYAIGAALEQLVESDSNLHRHDPARALTAAGASGGQVHRRGEG